MSKSSRTKTVLAMLGGLVCKGLAMVAYTVQCLIDDLSLVPNRDAVVLVLVEHGEASCHVDLGCTVGSLQKQLEVHAESDLAVCAQWIDLNGRRRNLVYKLVETADEKEVILYTSELPFYGDSKTVWTMHLGNANSFTNFRELVLKPQKIVGVFPV